MLIVDWLRVYLLRLRVCCPQETARMIWSDISRPVIVAENMIGCAMYELVCERPKLETESEGLTFP